MSSRLIQKKVKNIIRELKELHPELDDILETVDEKPDEILFLVDEDNATRYGEDVFQFERDFQTSIKFLANLKRKNSQKESQEIKKDFYILLNKYFEDIFPDSKPPSQTLKNKSSIDNTINTTVDDDNLTRKRSRVSTSNDNNDSLEKETFTPSPATVITMIPSERAILKSILQEICKHELVDPFLYPVDQKMFPEYYEMIEHPVDLSTIKKKLNNKEFNTINEVLADIRQVWENCCIFNAEESDIYHSAITLADYTEGLIKDYLGKEYVKKKSRGRKSQINTIESVESHVTVKPNIPISKSTTESQANVKEFMKIKNDSNSNSNSNSNSHKSVKNKDTSTVSSNLNQSQLAIPGDASKSSLLAYIHELKNHDKATPFLEPLDWASIEGYLDMITKPMDLTTIELYEWAEELYNWSKEIMKMKRGRHSGDGSGNVKTEKVDVTLEGVGTGTSSVKSNQNNGKNIYNNNQQKEDKKIIITPNIKRQSLDDDDEPFSGDKGFNNNIDINSSANKIKRSDLGPMGMKCWKILKFIFRHGNSQTFTNRETLPIFNDNNLDLITIRSQLKKYDHEEGGEIFLKDINSVFEYGMDVYPISSPEYERAKSLKEYTKELFHIVGRYGLVPNTPLPQPAIIPVTATVKVPSAIKLNASTVNNSSNNTTILPRPKVPVSIPSMGGTMLPISTSTIPTSIGMSMGTAMTNSGSLFPPLDVNLLQKAASSTGYTVGSKVPVSANSIIASNIANNQLPHIVKQPYVSPLDDLFIIPKTTNTSNTTTTNNIVTNSVGINQNTLSAVSNSTSSVTTSSFSYPANFTTSTGNVNSNITAGVNAISNTVNVLTNNSTTPSALITYDSNYFHSLSEETFRLFVSQIVNHSATTGTVTSPSSVSAKTNTTLTQFQTLLHNNGTEISLIKPAIAYHSQILSKQVIKDNFKLDVDDSEIDLDRSSILPYVTSDGVYELLKVGKVSQDKLFSNSHNLFPKGYRSKIFTRLYILPNNISNKDSCTSDTTSTNIDTNTATNIPKMDIDNENLVANSILPVSTNMGLYNQFIKLEIICSIHSSEPVQGKRPKTITSRNSSVLKPISSENGNSPIFELNIDGVGSLIRAYNIDVAWNEVLQNSDLVLSMLSNRLKRCRAVFNQLCCHPDIVPFLEQVPMTGPVGIEYYKAIKSPIWLRLIHTRLIEGTYDNEFDFAWDVRLVFTNCMLFNAKDSDIYKSAENLLDIFENLLCYWVHNIQDNSIYDFAKGPWDDWQYLRYFDSINPKLNCCRITNKIVDDEDELIFCNSCEDQYLPNAIGLTEPISKNMRDKWLCKRCQELSLLSNKSIPVSIVANSSKISHIYLREENNGYYFFPIGAETDKEKDILSAVTAVGAGLDPKSLQGGLLSTSGWCQARRKKGCGGKLMHVYLSPLGYTIYSKDDIETQKQFEQEVHTNLLKGRETEFQDEIKNISSSNKNKKNKKNRHQRQNTTSPLVIRISTRNKTSNELGTDSIPTEIDKNSIGAITSTPVVATDEEGVLVIGKLCQFQMTSDINLIWCLEREPETINQQNNVLIFNNSQKSISSTAAITSTVITTDIGSTNNNDNNSTTDIANTIETSALSLPSNASSDHSQLCLTTEEKLEIQNIIGSQKNIFYKYIYFKPQSPSISITETNANTATDNSDKTVILNTNMIESNLSGATLYGLNNPMIRKMLESQKAALLCTNYIFDYSLKAKNKLRLDVSTVIEQKKSIKTASHTYNDIILKERWYWDHERYINKKVGIIENTITNDNHVKIEMNVSDNDDITTNITSDSKHSTSISTLPTGFTELFPNSHFSTKDCDIILCIWDFLESLHHCTNREVLSTTFSLKDVLKSLTSPSNIIVPTYGQALLDELGVLFAEIMLLESSRMLFAGNPLPLVTSPEYVEKRKEIEISFESAMCYKPLNVLTWPAVLLSSIHAQALAYDIFTLPYDHFMSNFTYDFIISTPNQKKAIIDKCINTTNTNMFAKETFQFMKMYPNIDDSLLGDIMCLFLSHPLLPYYLQPVFNNDVILIPYLVSETNTNTDINLESNKKIEGTTSKTICDEISELRTNYFSIEYYNTFSSYQSFAQEIYTKIYKIFYYATQGSKPNSLFNQLSKYLFLWIKQLYVDFHIEIDTTNMTEIINNDVQNQTNYDEIIKNASDFYAAEHLVQTDENGRKIDISSFTGHYLNPYLGMTEAFPLYSHIFPFKKNFLQVYELYNSDTSDSNVNNNNNQSNSITPTSTSTVVDVDGEVANDNNNVNKKSKNMIKSVENVSDLSYFLKNIDGGTLPLKLKILNSLQQCVYNLRHIEPESWTQSDRMNILTTCVDQCCRTFLHRNQIYRKQEIAFTLKQFKWLKPNFDGIATKPSQDLEFENVKLNVNSTHKNSVCNFLNIKAKYFNPTASWVVVPEWLINEPIMPPSNLSLNSKSSVKSLLIPLPARTSTTGPSSDSSDVVTSGDDSSATNTAVAATNDTDVSLTGNRPTRGVKRSASDSFYSNSSKYARTQTNTSSSGSTIPISSEKIVDAVAAMREHALREKLNYSDHIKLLAKQLNLAAQQLKPLTKSEIQSEGDKVHSLCNPASPLGYDKYGNEYWLLRIQEYITINSMNIQLQIIPVLEPYILMKQANTGKWYHHNGKDIETWLKTHFSYDIPCERILQDNLIERLYFAKRKLLHGQIKLKAPQIEWIARYTKCENIFENYIRNGIEIRNDKQFSWLLELLWARCYEIRSYLYYSYFYKDDIDDRTIFPSQRAERDANTKKIKKLKDSIADDFFDLNPSLGWTKSGPIGKLRSLTACTIASKLLSEPSLLSFFQGRMRNSRFRSAMFPHTIPPVITSSSNTNQLLMITDNNNISNNPTTSTVTTITTSHTSFTYPSSMTSSSLINNTNTNNNSNSNNNTRTTGSVLPSPILPSPILPPGMVTVTPHATATVNNNTVTVENKELTVTVKDEDSNNHLDTNQKNILTQWHSFLTQQHQLSEKHHQLQLREARNAGLLRNKVKYVEVFNLVTRQVLRVFPSQKDAANELKVSQAGISQACSGLRSDCYGVGWRFYQGPLIDFEAMESKFVSRDDIMKMMIVRNKSHYDEVYGNKQTTGLLMSPPRKDDREIIKDRDSITGRPSELNEDEPSSPQKMPREYEPANLLTEENLLQNFAKMYPQLSTGLQQLLELGIATFDIPVVNEISTNINRNPSLSSSHHSAVGNILPSTNLLSVNESASSTTAVAAAVAKTTTTTTTSTPALTTYTKNLPNIILSDTAQHSRLLKLKSEFISIFFAIPEKLLKWPSTDIELKDQSAESTSKVQQTSDAIGMKDTNTTDIDMDPAVVTNTVTTTTTTTTPLATPDMTVVTDTASMAKNISQDPTVTVTVSSQPLTETQSTAVEKVLPTNSVVTENIVPPTVDTIVTSIANTESIPVLESHNTDMMDIVPPSSIEDSTVTQTDKQDDITKTMAITVTTATVTVTSSIVSTSVETSITNELTEKLEEDKKIKEKHERKIQRRQKRKQFNELILNKLKSASTPYEVLELVCMVEAALPVNVWTYYNYKIVTTPPFPTPTSSVTDDMKSISTNMIIESKQLSSTQTTTSYLALRIYALDRSIRYEDLKGIDTTILGQERDYKTHTQYIPKCCISVDCIRSLYHDGKCSNIADQGSRMVEISDQPIIPTVIAKYSNSINSASVSSNNQVIPPSVVRLPVSSGTPANIVKPSGNNIYNSGGVNQNIHNNLNIRRVVPNMMEYQALLKRDPNDHDIETVQPYIPNGSEISAFGWV